MASVIDKLHDFNDEDDSIEVDVNVVVVEKGMKESKESLLSALRLVPLDE